MQTRASAGTSRHGGAAAARWSAPVRRSPPGRRDGSSAGMRGGSASSRRGGSTVGRRDGSAAGRGSAILDGQPSHNLDRQASDANVASSSRVMTNSTSIPGGMFPMGHNINNPGPMDPSVLRLQESHRSTQIWDGKVNDVLMVRQHKIVWQPQLGLHTLLTETGFYGISQIPWMRIDHALITALVERWRQETHTFHFRVGEMTVTLQDVSLILGLTITGKPVIENLNEVDWDKLCEDCFGIVSIRKEDRPTKASVSLSWLKANFSGPLPQDASIIQQHQYLRAYLMSLFGSVLFTDKSGNAVSLVYLVCLKDISKIASYSWGSAVLCYLYRCLCKASCKGAMQIGGPMLLLQLWCWERLHIGRPKKLPSKVRRIAVVEGGEGEDAELGAADGVVDVGPDNLEMRLPLANSWAGAKTYVDNPRSALIYYRDQLDLHKNYQVLWEPYTPERLLTVRPTLLEEHERERWTASVPLILFAFVELHTPNRVSLQFGRPQYVPCMVDTNDQWHKMTMRGRIKKNWKRVHQNSINVWTSYCRYDESDDEAPDAELQQYFEWYARITRHVIGPILDSDHHSEWNMQFEPMVTTNQSLIDGLVRIAHHCTSTRPDVDMVTMHSTMSSILGICIDTLNNVGVGGRFERDLQLHKRRKEDQDSSLDGTHLHGNAKTHPPLPAEDPIQLPHPAQYDCTKGGSKPPLPNPPQERLCQDQRGVSMIKYKRKTPKSKRN